MVKMRYYSKLADSVIKKFALRGIDGYYCETKGDALEKAKSFLPNTLNVSIAVGGSMSLEEIGLVNELKALGYTIYDRAKAKTREEKDIVDVQIFQSDFYYTSTNAITFDGQLVNIDSKGNRVASLIHGPKNVIIIAGMNKVVKNVDTAIERVENYAGPLNAVRKGLDCLPCTKLGYCVHCLEEFCICCQTVITRKSREPGRIKVILVGEDLGY